MRVHLPVMPELSQNDTPACGIPRFQSEPPPGASGVPRFRFHYAESPERIGRLFVLDSGFPVRVGHGKTERAAMADLILALETELGASEQTLQYDAINACRKAAIEYQRVKGLHH